MVTTSRRTFCTLVFLLTCSTAARPAEPPPAQPPKLVLFIIVDQLRGDVPLRFAGRFDEGGFRRLTERGLHYSNAHYNYAVTYTAVGHATLATGGGPAEHGMVGNDWADPSTARRVYCVEDPRHGQIGRPPAEHEGAGPANLIGTTIGDELVAASGGRSRVFSVSAKDRGAIILGGRLGKAFWGGKDGRFVTTTYYYGDL